MDKELLRNGSEYVDMTAYLAMSRMRGDTQMEVLEGDIFVQNSSDGKEREFVIVAVNDNVATVLMLLDNDTLPYSIVSTHMRYTHPGMLQYIFCDRFDRYVRSLSESDLDDLRSQVAKYIGFNGSSNTEVREVVKEVIKEVPVEVIKEVPCDSSAEIAEAKAEAKIYKDLYERLLSKVMG